MTHVSSPLLIRPAQSADCEALCTVLELTVRDGFTGDVLFDEIDEILASVSESATDEESARKYLVAERAGRIVGMMGLSSEVDNATAGFAQSENPLEIISAYVDPESRGMGAGRALVGALTEIATADGATEVILNSGPRYEEFGWKFWRKMFGEPVGISQDHYDIGAHAPVWSKLL